MDRQSDTYQYIYKKLNQLSSDPFSSDGNFELSDDLFMLGEMIAQYDTINISKEDDTLHSLCIDSSLYEAGSNYTVTKKQLLERLDKLFTN